MSITSILLFVLILLVLVIVHEFGHFIVAKLTKMRVDEFAFGFPPRIFAKKYGETTYAVNALPLGGYVSIWGENGSEEDKEKGGAKHHPRAFGNRPWWAQLLVLIAGVTMNMLLAFIIFVGVSYGNVNMSTNDSIYGTRVHDAFLVSLEVSKESPAFKAGIVAGSKILRVTNGSLVADLSSADSFVSFVETHQNTPFTITYTSSDNQKKSTTIAAVYGIVPNKKALGIAVDKIGVVKISALEALSLGYERTLDTTQETFIGILSVFTAAFSGGDAIKSLSGPVGIAKIVGERSEYGISAILTLVAVLSINLAIFNILPLPALDGGRIVVVIIESIFRKKIPYKYYAWVNVTGFLALMLLLVIVTVNDIRG
jgi:regulator of sigma E protease